jgi:NAD-dependent DNA ligase
MSHTFDLTFTGTDPSGLSRAQLIEIAQRAGFHVRSSWTTKTNLVIAEPATRPSRKLLAAHIHRTTVWTYETFHRAATALCIHPETEG